MKQVNSGMEINLPILNRQDGQKQTSAGETVNILMG